MQFLRFVRLWYVAFRKAVFLPFKWGAFWFVCPGFCTSIIYNLNPKCCGCVSRELRALCCLSSVLISLFTVSYTVVYSLVDLQLDAQNSYLFTYNTFIKILNMFRALPCSSSGGLCRNCIYAASGIVTICRWLSCAPVKIPETAYIQLRRRPPEDEHGSAWNI